MNPQKISNIPDELTQKRGDIEKLETEKLLRGNEIRALKVETLSYQDELRSLSDKVQTLKKQALQETPVGNIEKEVRLRYLGRHRQRMRRSIDKQRLGKTKLFSSFKMNCKIVMIELLLQILVDDRTSSHNP